VYWASIIVDAISDDVLNLDRGCTLAASADERKQPWRHCGDRLTTRIADV
jgi:hypothetical protein